MNDLKERLIDINKCFMNNKSIYFLSNILSVMPSYLDLVVHKRDKLIIYINPSNFISVITFLLKSTQFKYVQLLDVLGVDYPERFNRFEVNYLLLSISNSFRILIKTYASEFSYIPSLTSLFYSSN